MQISVRSQLTAGMVAVVGAGAIAMTPVVMPTNAALSVAPTTVVADVQLAAFSFSDVLGILQTLGLGGALPDITSLLPANVLTAVVGEFINEAGPVVTGAAGEVLTYLTGAVTGLIVGGDSVLARIIGAVGNIPGVLTSAVQSLTGGDIPTAIQTVLTGLVAPVTAIGQAINDAISSLQTFVTTKLTTVANALPGILLNSIQVALGLGGNVSSLLSTVQSVIQIFVSGLIPGAAAVAPVAAAARVAAVASPVAAAAPAVAAAVSAVAPRAKRSASAAAARSNAAVSTPAAEAVSVASDVVAAAKPAPAPRPAAAGRHARAAAAASAE